MDNIDFLCNLELKEYLPILSYEDLFEFWNKVLELQKIYPERSNFLARDAVGFSMSFLHNHPIIILCRIRYYFLSMEDLFPEEYEKEWNMMRYLIKRKEYKYRVQELNLEI